MAKPMVLVTGANGHLGRLVIDRLTRGPDAGRFDVRAAVRSERAAQQVASNAVDASRVDIRQVDYTNEKSLAEAAEGCFAVVHLVGIIKETRAARYVDAHEHACEALAAAATAAGVERIVYLSIFGSRPDSPNACLASKGSAERTLLAGPVPVCVLRVPMVLGPGDYASFSLGRQARGKLLPLLGGGRTLQQPIDARDVVSAVVACLGAAEPLDVALDLGGPECLPHRDLVARAAALYDNRPTVVPVPLGLVRAGVGLLERLAPEPPMTVAMLDVLEHDDDVNATEALERLGLTLTPLADTLAAYIGPDANAKDGDET